MRPFPYLAITPVPANLVSILKLASKFISINVSPGCFQLEGHREVSSGLAWQTGHKGLFATLRLYKFE
ncbi:hypothetical protein F383_08248 [Gossypium arboreum]|uniref:Uncharacterized protein n=1 Tax=Gossypium arboreum TaxID=29729 RepID=A0A0B0NA58_GOSAR|nr:hypothetical protein F383_08248 [Gossypium arboreum]